MKRLGTYWCAIAIMVLILHGCILSAAAQSLRRGNIEPESLDPQKSNFLFEQSIEHDTFEGLVVLSSSGEVEAGAAKSWEISPDGTRYTFHLREGLRWSNGERLSAKDFVYSFRRLVDPATKSQAASMADPIRNAAEIRSGKNPKIEELGIEAVGDSIVRITLAASTPYFLSALTSACFSPVNRDEVEHATPDAARSGLRIGNGAYVLEEWTPNVRIVLKKNPRYWDAAHVRIPEVQYLPMPDASKEFQSYLAGELDITWDVPAAEIARAKERGKELKIFPFFGLYYFSFEVNRPPFKDNAKLRQALAMAIDREMITEKILGGGERPAYSWVPPGLRGYESQTVEWNKLSREARVAAARQLYAEAGYGPKKPLKAYLQRSNTEVRKKIADAILQQWKEVLGVEGTASAEDPSPAIRADSSVGCLRGSGWNADYADPNTFLDIWRSDSTENPGFSNIEYDSLMRKAAKDSDPRERAKTFQQAERILLTQMPFVAVYDSVLKKMVKPNVVGYSPNVLGYAYSRNISFAAGKK